MTSYITEQPLSLGEAGLKYPLSTRKPSQAMVDFTLDPALLEWWQPDCNWGSRWAGRKNRYVATMLAGSVRPKIKKTTGGLFYAKWGISTLKQAVFACPADLALLPLAGDFTVGHFYQTDTDGSNFGSFIGDGRKNASLDGGSVNTGCANFGFGSSSGLLYGQFQNRNAGAVATPILNSTPNLYMGRHYVLWSYRFSTKMLRLIVDGAVVKTQTGITKALQSTQFLIGGNSDCIVDPTTKVCTIDNGLRTVRLMGVMVWNQALGETDQVASLNKTKAVFDPRLLIA